MEKLFHLIPVTIVLILIGLTLHKSVIETPQLSAGQKIPDFDFIQIIPNKPMDTSRTLSNSNSLPPGPFLINFFGSWCASCRVQHDVLLRLKHKNHISIIGFAVKDNERDINYMIKNHGDPFIRIGLVPESYDFRNKWDVTQTPTTFLVDSKGLIRYRFDKIMTAQDVEKTLLPLIEKIEKET